MSRYLAIVLALTVALTVGAVPAGAQPRVGARPAAPQNLQQLGTFADFNGDSRTDLAVGAPLENVGATADAGAVSIFYGIAAGTGLPSASQTLLQAVSRPATSSAPPSPWGTSTATASRIWWWERRARIWAPPSMSAW
jgi:hypothetical protein